MHLPCCCVGDHGFPFFRAPVNHLAIGILDTIDNVRPRRSCAAAGKHGVSERALLQRNLTRAEIGVGKRTQGGLDAGILGHFTHGLETGLEPDTDRGRILAADKRFACRHLAVVLVVDALNAPLTENPRGTADPDQAVVQSPILHDRSGENPLLEGRSINNRQERCAERSPPLHTAVVFAVAEIASADHDNNPAGLVVQNKHGALQVSRLLGVRIPQLGRICGKSPGKVLETFIAVARTLFNLGGPPLQGFLCRALHVGIDRGVNTESAIHGPVISEGGNGLLPDIVQSVGLPDGLRALAHGERFSQRLAISCGIKHTEIPHLPQHHITIGLGSFDVGPRREAVRAFQQSGKHGGLRSREIGGRHAEIAARRRLGSVKTAAEIDAVQIHLHDLFLGEILLDLQSKGHFEELATVSALLEFEGIARQLLRDRAGALTDPPRRPVGLCGAQDTEIIDTVVIPETLVFRGDDRVDQQG